jgi:hypothetical protein
MKNKLLNLEEAPRMKSVRPIYTAVPARVPLDLSDWVGRTGLACLVLEAATDASAQAFEGLYQNDQAALTRAKTLLALLTYCYAAGICASDEIELQAMDDPMVRYLAGSTPPDWSRLRAFRRQWHAVIHDSLVRLFTLAWARQVEQRDEFCLAGGELEHRPEDNREPNVSGCFHIEAERRINRAVLLDSMFADD